MKLLNCMCGAKALTDDHYIVCSNADCYTIGPDNDTTGERWNALMAPHQKTENPKEPATTKPFDITKPVQFRNGDPVFRALLARYKEISE